MTMEYNRDFEFGEDFDASIGEFCASTDGLQSKFNGHFTSPKLFF